MNALPARLLQLRAASKEGKDPTCADETLALLLSFAKKGGRALEIGAGEGLTSAALALGGMEVVAIERDHVRCTRAETLFFELSLTSRITLLEGDAGKILPTLAGEFDLIFLDGPKVQYRRYFSDCKRLLRRGGTLVSDDVLLYGWVRGTPPPKRRMLAEHLREYLALLQSDPDFTTQIYEYGEGVAVSQKR